MLIGYESDKAPRRNTPSQMTTGPRVTEVFWFAGGQPFFQKRTAFLAFPALI
jgi:hypothetical protein